MTAAVETTALTKEFEKGCRTVWQRLRREPDRRERFRAVDAIDLRVEEGEIFGVLGPNGAGKTTTLKMLVSLVAMTGVGYIVAAAVLLTKEANFLVDTTNFLFGILSGTAFPISVLPLVAQVVAVLLPTTWAVEILRHHAIGARTVFDPALEHVLLLASTALVIPLGLWAFRAADRYVRVHGTIAQH